MQWLFFIYLIVLYIFLYAFLISLFLNYRINLLIEFKIIKNSEQLWKINQIVTTLIWFKIHTKKISYVA